ncbi:hypothetical protein [Halostella sp. PRR32]|uniref:hypothetical protein n=1 Tax=Halostella sp. PRR32 TaxID=3098147 RepID=UPI002B1E5561|nr:hypothetical protein [Halostella sp. PRR32]
MSELTDGVFAVEPGDEVRVATDRYEWSSPMDVQDIEHVEWTPTDGEPWATRTVELEGGYSTEFVVSCSEGDTEIALHSGDKLRGYLERFEVLEDVDDTEPDDSETEDGGADEGSDGEQDEEDELSAVDIETPGDGDDDQDAGDEDDADIALPDGVSEQDVRDACKKHQALGAVAEVLEIPAACARTVTVALGCYQHVSDVTGTRYGGVADVK